MFTVRRLRSPAEDIGPVFSTCRLSEQNQMCSRVPYAPYNYT